MSLRTLTSLLALLAVSCSSSRVPVTLDKVDIHTVDHATIFADHMYPGAKSGQPRQVVQLSVSSQTELIKYYADHGKQMQLRCSVDGTSGRNDYGNTAFGPFPEYSASSKRYHYVIYAFVDLQAYSAEYKDGKPASKIDLKSVKFDSLSCQLVGVEMAPLPFLRSSDLFVSESTFRSLLRQSAKQ